jgi:hypothetical protein
LVLKVTKVHRARKVLLVLKEMSEIKVILDSKAHKV